MAPQQTPVFELSTNVDGFCLSGRKDGVCIWSDNALLSLNLRQSDNEKWVFNKIDVISRKTKPIVFPKTNSKFFSINIFPFDGVCGFAVENSRELLRVNFVNLTANKFEMVDFIELSIDCETVEKISVNLVKEKTFLLKFCYSDHSNFHNNDIYFYYVFNLKNAMFEKSHSIVSRKQNLHYYNGKFIELAQYVERGKVKTKIGIEEDSGFNWQITGMLPNEFKFFDFKKCKWIKEYVYVFAGKTIYFESGLVFMDLKTMLWTFIELNLLPLCRTINVCHGNLLIYSQHLKKESLYQINAGKWQQNCLPFKVVHYSETDSSDSGSDDE